MSYISYFIYSEDARNEGMQNDSKLHIIEPMHIFTPAFVPSLYSFCVVFGILDIKLDGSHSLRYTFKGPEDGRPYIIDTGNILLPVQDNLSYLPDDMNGIMMNFDFRNIPFEIGGEYVSEIFINDESLGTFPIKVKGMKRDDPT